MGQTLALLASAACLLLPGQALTDTKVRTSSFVYGTSTTNLGLLIKEVVEPDSPQDCLQTSYAYDAQGNKTSVSTSACASSGTATWSASSPRTASSTYAAQTSVIAGVTYTIPEGMFPSQTSNALGQSERKTYDPRFGVVTSLVGPNSLTTTWVYDSFGRKIRENRADNSFTTWRYQLCDTNAIYCNGVNIAGAIAEVMLIEQDYYPIGSASGHEKRQYLDTLGRVVRIETKGFDGNASGAPAQTLLQDTEYNALGQVARKSNLYASGTSPVWSNFEYDKIGRVIRQDSPDIAPNGSATVSSSYISYAGLSTTVTNAKGQSKTTVKNAQGQVASVTDHLGSTIVYTYDALGQLLQTNAAGSITKMEYNQRGQKVKMQDPAMGEWLYAYNAFGELVWQRDSLSQTVTMAYDSLGRMTQRNEADLKSYWAYDKNFDNTACLKGTGKLCQAKTDTGYLRSHVYDSLGRIGTTTTVLGTGTTPASVSVAYDVNTARVTSKTWPTGYKASYQYTAAGFLKKVTGQGLSGTVAGSTTVASYEIMDIDAQGRIRSYKYGNQVTTVNNYDVPSGKLLGIQASLAGGTASGVLNQTYQYDSLANLTQRVDGNTNVSETFQYDGLNRLSNYQAIGGALSAASPNNDVQVMYDVRGNINYKSDVGQYWYDSARPNRMTAVTLSTPVGGKALTGTRLMAYAFDDYRPGAKTVNGTVLGNGNLMYTVSQDTSQNRHNVRWETYTSFNMPSEIKYASLVNTAAGVSTGASTTATHSITCPEGATLSGTNCISVSTLSPSVYRL